MKYDIFISYRRDGGFETANLIAEKLRNAGYRIFLDVESLRSGKFNEQLYAVIEQCKDFVVVLPKDGLNRCHNETDWVRLEAIHAMRHDKNIIPVMLSGFTWPSVMPPGMDELCNFQGVAAGNHDYFDASIDKLKKYLKSIPRKKTPTIFLWLLISCIGFCVLWLVFRQLAVPVCVEQANKITSKISIIDLLTTETKTVGKEWDKYYRNYAMATSNDTSFLNNQMRSILKHRRQEIRKLQRDTTTFRISGFQHFMLYVRGVDVSEIEIFHQSFYPSYFDDAIHRLDLLETFLRMDMIPEISLSTNEQNMRYAQHAANLAYYGYLELLLPMPQKALKSYKELSVVWANFPITIGLNLPKEEYERLQKTELEKMNALIGEIGFLTTEQALQLEREEKNLSRLKANKEDQKDQAIETRINNLMKKSAEIGTKRQQLQDMARQLDDFHRQVFEKCTLLPEDDQYLMWGKIIRIATLMGQTCESRRAAKLQNEKEKAEAKAEGIDVSDWYEVQYTVTTGDMLREINQRLDAYLSYFPDTKAYIESVKQFYSLVESGKQPLVGMAVAVTKDDLPHPVLNLGDIVIARKEKSVNNTADYKMAKEIPGDDVITFLRLDDNGRLVTHEETVPQTEVLVGFLELKEEK